MPPSGLDRFLLAILRLYKMILSPYFAGSCRFLPSCADYARDAVLIHGATRGSWLAFRRLVRCQPFCTAGHDPVPLPHDRPRPAAPPELARSSQGLPW